MIGTLYFLEIAFADWQNVDPQFLLPLAATPNKKREFFFLTPEIRSIKDELKFDFWKKSPSSLWIDDFQLDIFEQK